MVGNHFGLQIDAKLQIRNHLALTAGDGDQAVVSSTRRSHTARCAVLNEFRTASARRVGFGDHFGRAVTARTVSSASSVMTRSGSGNWPLLSMSPWTARDRTEPKISRAHIGASKAW